MEQHTKKVIALQDVLAVKPRVPGLDYHFYEPKSTYGKIEDVCSIRVYYNISLLYRKHDTQHLNSQAITMFSLLLMPCDP